MSRFRVGSTVIAAKGSCFCEICCRRVAVAEHVVEREEGHDVAGDPCIRYWDFKILKCGHEAEDRSY